MFRKSLIEGFDCKDYRRVSCGGKAKSCGCVLQSIQPSLLSDSLGLDLLLHAVLHSQGQLAELVPLLSQANGRVLCVTVVQYEVLLQQGTQLLNLPQSLFPVRYLTCLGLHSQTVTLLSMRLFT